MPTTRLIYFSENQIDPDNGSVVQALREILRASNRNNKPKGLTGALVFDDQWFLQVLEGDRASVWQTFEHIRDDERHAGLVVAELVEIDARVFANWWMGLATRTAKTEEIFARFAHDSRFDPRRMTAAEMLAMTVALSRFGLFRELAQHQADGLVPAG